MDTICNSLFIRAQHSAHLMGQRVTEQDGATTVEYVMILGIMALLVAAIFLIPELGLRALILKLGQSVQGVVGDASASNGS